jgi:DNA-binding transcriptional LysR family regulator
VNLASFDLNLLLVLEALLIERSATRAGKRVGLSQSAVSNALARLRGSLGDPLFVRGKEAMTPTAFALALEAPIREALATLRSSLHAPDRFDPQRSSYRARIATTDYAEIVLLSRLARRVRARAPGITLDARRLARVYELPVASLEKGEVEFALGAFERLPPGRGLRGRRILVDRMVLLAAPGAKRMTLDRFARLPHVKVLYGADLPGIVGEALARAGTPRFAPIVTPHFAAVAHYVRGTDVLGIVPERLARTQARALGLKVLRLPIALPTLESTLVWHERNDANPPHAWLRALAE